MTASKSYMAACPTCGAVTGEPCTVRSWPRPRRAHYTHAPRKRLVAASSSAHPIEETAGE